MRFRREVDRCEHASNVPRRLPAIVGIVGDAASDHLVERGRLHPLPRIVAPGRHLDEQTAQPIDVGARIGRRAGALLWRHVGRRPHHHAFFRQRVVARLPGDAEIEHLHAGSRHHDVAGLEIPVRDLIPVRGIERIGDLNAVLDHLGQGQRALQDLAVDALHDEVVDALVRTDVVQRADVRMLKRGDGLGLADEPPLVGAPRLAQHLDGHRTIEAAVAGLVNGAHAAVTEQRDDLVVTDAGAGGQSHRVRLNRASLATKVRPSDFHENPRRSSGSLRPPVTILHPVERAETGRRSRSTVIGRPIRATRRRIVWSGHSSSHPGCCSLCSGPSSRPAPTMPCWNGIRSRWRPRRQRDRGLFPSCVRWPSSRRPCTTP